MPVSLETGLGKGHSQIYQDSVVRPTEAALVNGAEADTNHEVSMLALKPEAIVVATVGLLTNKVMAKYATLGTGSAKGHLHLLLQAHLQAEAPWTAHPATTANERDEIHQPGVKAVRKMVQGRQGKSL